MHIIVSQLAYWASLGMILCGASFIGFIEFYDRIHDISVTVDTPGWRGLVPSYLLVATVFLAVASSLSVVISVWFF